MEINKINENVIEVKREYTDKFSREELLDEKEMHEKRIAELEQLLSHFK